MNHNFFEIKHIFPVDQLSTYSKALGGTTSDTLSSTQNMDRCVSIMKGDNTTSLKKFVSLVRKNNSDSEDYEIISSFYTHTQPSVDILNIKLCQNSTGLYHNVIVSKISTWEPVHRVPPDLWDLKYQVTCYKAFDIFSRAELSSLKTLLVAMENFPSETYLLLYPLIGSILGFTIFYQSFSYLSAGKFLDTLFKRTVERIHGSPLKVREILNYSPSTICISIAGVASISTIYSIISYLEIEKIQQKSINLSDSLSNYRFTGNTGVAIRIFKDNTGAIAYSVFKTWNTYKKIVILSLLEPMWNLGKKVAESSGTWGNERT